MDSERWKEFAARDDDIVITTSYKAGTTWMQGICAALVFQQPRPPVPQDELTPWLDARFAPIEMVLQQLEGLSNRRYIKTHTPLDGIRFFDCVKYIFVGRDGRDVWMSMWNHWHNMQPESIDALNNAEDRQGPLMAHAADDIQPAFDAWLSKGTFPWENNGYPFWSHLHHAQTWWDYRYLPNILFVHFDDLLKDLDGQMRRISAYLDIPIDENIWPDLVEGVTFKSMKANAHHMAPGATGETWKDNSNFFHQGRNRRWESALTRAQSDAYERLAERELDPELARWLERGGEISLS